LKCFDVRHDIADALLHHRIVILIQGQEQRSSDGHVSRPMRWVGAAAASELQDARYGIRGILAITLLGQLRQVRWR
jgi:hypothetical protein